MPTNYTLAIIGNSYIGSAIIGRGAEWVTPKTDWVNGDIFNLTPDYDRIKGNIEYLVEIGNDAYPSWTISPLGTYTITDFAPTTFFTDIVNSVNTIKDNTVLPYGWITLRTNYSTTIWTADDLNAIETDIKLLYEHLAPGVVKYYSGIYEAGRIPDTVVDNKNGITPQAIADQAIVDVSVLSS